MRLYALVEAGDPEAVGDFVREDDALGALMECLRDEPQWNGLLRVAAIELEAPDSPN